MYAQHTAHLSYTYCTVTLYVLAMTAVCVLYDVGSVCMCPFVVTIFETFSLVEVIFRTHFAGFMCFNVHMMQYRWRLHHARAEGKCITELRAVLHCWSGHIKTHKASKVCPKCFIAIR